MNSPLHRVMAAEQAIWLLATLCRQHRIPFDTALFLERHPPRAGGNYALADILLAAENLGLRQTCTALTRDSDPTLLALPALAFLRATAEKDAIAPEQGAQQQATPLLLIAAGADD